MTEFERLFIENKNMIYRYLLKLSGNPSLAEELTDEAFFIGYMNYSSLKNKDKASLWLCQIAKNLYFAYYNKQKKISCSELTETKDEKADLQNSLEEKESADRILVCLHSLEEPYKEVFMLSVFGELSFKDISSLFGKSESWARVTFYRAKQKITERMRNEK